MCAIFLQNILFSFWVTTMENGGAGGNGMCIWVKKAQRGGKMCGNGDPDVDLCIIRFTPLSLTTTTDFVQFTLENASSFHLIPVKSYASSFPDAQRKMTWMNMNFSCFRP